VVYDPSGKLLREIEFSGKNMTCPTFGGKNLDLLFVTSGRKEPNDADEGGSLFKYKLEQGIRGTEKYQFAM
jgi:sugar lactone lactonase YvrE